MRSIDTKAHTNVTADIRPVPFFYHPKSIGNRVSEEQKNERENNKTSLFFSPPPSNQSISQQERERKKTVIRNIRKRGELIYNSYVISPPPDQREMEWLLTPRKNNKQTNIRKQNKAPMNLSTSVQSPKNKKGYSILFCNLRASPGIKNVFFFLFFFSKCLFQQTCFDVLVQLETQI